MLTQAQYNNLWTATLGMPIINIPCYYQYLQREVYFQDYLDLFCCPNGGLPTFPRNNRNGILTVTLPYTIPLVQNPTYTVMVNGNVELIVEYQFPFFNQLCQNREIRYILIGEAAPSPSIPLLNVNGEDKSNTYFYNKNHTGSTNYFSAPVDAFHINRQQAKANKLVGLADKGVLLLDLFPFAIIYTTEFRKSLNRNNITQSFWDDVNNPYSIINRLQNIAGCLNNKWDLSLMATPTISKYIVQNFQPIIINANNGLHPNQFVSILSHQDRYSNNTLRKITNSNKQGILYAPTADLIKKSF